MQGFFSSVRSNFRWYLLFGLMIFSIVLWIRISHEEKRGILTFALLNIGQGDAIFIESPTGTQIVVDGGPNNTLMREISKVMPWYDRHIDMLVVTNPDRDHYEGFISLLKKYSTATLLEPGTTNDNDVYKHFQKQISDRGIKKVVARRGQVIDIGGGAYLQILFPDRDVSGLSPNDGSIVMKLVYGETSIMLQGDSTAKIENYLLALGTTTLKSTILKAGHHGSRTSSDENYVRVVDPEWTVISSGVENDYGHPHKEILETMDKLGIPTYDTCNNGKIVFESDGKTFTLKNKNIKEAVVGCRI